MTACPLPSLVAVFALALAPATATGELQIPHEALAKELMLEAGIAEQAPELLQVQGLLDGAYLRADLGLFELYARKKSLGEAVNAQSFQSVAKALLEAQSVLLRWVSFDAPPAQAVEDLEAALKWVESWRPGKLADAAEVGEASLAASSATQEALTRLASLMRSGRALSLLREEERAEPIVLCPTRREFITFLSASAAIVPQNQAAFWNPQVVDWNYCYVERFKVLALEYASGGRSLEDWEAGTSMNERAPTGMEQQIVQLSVNSMLDNYFADRIPPSLAGALSINLVIELFGQCDTRIDGDLRERRTQAREVFVPGGMSEGGMLAPNFADSRWRSGGGADHFIRALGTGQAAGAKHSEEKGAKHQWFLLSDDESAARKAIRAPLLGSAAKHEALGDERLEGDRLDFLRAYRVAFLWWLQTKAEGSAKKSAQSSAKLLAAIATTPGVDIEQLFAEVYGCPLSTTDLTKDDLEGRFLHWLLKQ